jgi:hypothetical protein
MPSRVPSIKLGKLQSRSKTYTVHPKDSFDRVGESGGNRNLFHSFGDRGHQVDPEEIEI